MPSRHNPNKPKGKIQKYRHTSSVQRRKAAHIATQGPIRTSAGRYDSESVPKPTDSKAVAVYTGAAIPTGRSVTTNVCSNKRARKIERNMRYVARRNEQLSIDLAAKNEGMDVDVESVAKRVKETKPQTKLQKIKQALWTVAADASSLTMPVDASGEGTTVGVQAF